jgi:hypothetical protein
MRLISIPRIKPTCSIVTGSSVLRCETEDFLGTWSEALSGVIIPVSDPQGVLEDGMLIGPAAPTR